MPIYNRQTLRQRLGREFLHDLIVGQTSGSWGTQAGSLNIIDSAQADPTLSGEQVYFRAHLRLLGSAGRLQDLRVGSFNTGSGAFLAAITLATTVFSGMPFEVSTLVDPADKDRALDAVIKDVRVTNEVPLWSVKDALTYSVGTDIYDVLGVKYFSDPTHSLDRGEHQIAGARFITTASGQELRIPSGLPASYQLILNAITAASLGAGDLATVNLPSDELVLWGATARCYWMLARKAPAQETKVYEAEGIKAAKQYSKLAARFGVPITREPQLDMRW